MVNTGVHLHGLVPTPETTRPDEKHNTATHIEENPTESHALATTISAPRGAAETEHNQDELLDLGWQKDRSEIANPLIAGIHNEEIWTFTRRFDKQVFFLKETTGQSVGGLDLYLADDAEFSANKLRSQFERIYMGLIIGLVASLKHIARLRSWREPRRTGTLCTAYFTAWSLDMLFPLLLASLIALIVSERARDMAFPRAPISLVDRATGGPTHPEAGVLGSTDSATGAPQHMKGQAVENEASNFVTGVAGIAFNTLTAQDDTPKPENEEGERHIMDDMPGPDQAATAIASAKDKAAGVDRPSQDKTKKPMETLMWSYMQPLLHLLTLISDTWERVANALSPVPPFHPYLHRARLALTVGPFFISSLFVSAYTVTKVVSFAFGFILFGDPVITSATNWLDWVKPDWKKVVHINNTLLKGVPTNVQVAVTLLRHAEANRAPLPPAPQITGPPPMEPIELSGEVIDSAGADQPLAATGHELDEAAGRDDEKLAGAGGNDSELTSTQDKSSGKASKILNVFKGGAKAAVHAGLAVNKIRSKVGNNKASAKNSLGAVPAKSGSESAEYGPSCFSARWQGEEGVVYVAWREARPVVAFVGAKKSAAMRHAAGHDQESTGDIKETSQLDPQWTMVVSEITQLKKHAAFGTKTKLAIGWALERDISDGMEIIDRAGQSRVLTALSKRDELFNRLCSMGGQRWELW